MRGGGEPGNARLGRRLGKQALEEVIKIGHHEYSDASAGSRIELWSVLWYLLKPWKSTITWHKYVVNSYHPHRTTSRQNHTSDTAIIGRGHLTPDRAHFALLCGNILLSSSSPSSVLEFDVQCKKQARRTDQRDNYAL